MLQHRAAGGSAWMAEYNLCPFGRRICVDFLSHCVHHWSTPLRGTNGRSKIRWEQVISYPPFLVSVRVRARIYLHHKNR